MNWTVRILAHRATTFHVRMVVLASLFMALVASASVSLAAPENQGSTSADQSVNIANFAFAPAEVSIPVGATLTWTNAQDGVPHTTTSLDGIWDSGVLSTNDSFGFTFSQAGDFAYQCAIHPTMRGIVHVAADANTQPDGAMTNSPLPAPLAAAGSPQVTIASPQVTQAAAPTPTPPVVAPTPLPTGTPASSYHY